MSDIPPEAEALRREFLAQQAKEEAARAARKVGRLTKKARNETSEAFKPMTAGKIVRFARERGIEIQSGGGRHGTYLVAPDGAKCSLPDHGDKDLATGTCAEVWSFIHQHGARKS